MSAYAGSVPFSSRFAGVAAWAGTTKARAISSPIRTSPTGPQRAEPATRRLRFSVFTDGLPSIAWSASRLLRMAECASARCPFPHPRWCESRSSRGSGTSGSDGLISVRRRWCVLETEVPEAHDEGQSSHGIGPGTPRRYRRIADADQDQDLFGPITAPRRYRNDCQVPRVPGRSKGCRPLRPAPAGGPEEGHRLPPRPKESDVPHHRMRLPHARITILALCGLAAAAGVAGAAVSPDATPPSAPGPVAAYGFDGTGPRVADASDNANDGATTAARTQDGRFGRALGLDGRHRGRHHPGRRLAEAAPHRDARGLGSPGLGARLARHPGEGGRRQGRLRPQHHGRPAPGRRQLRLDPAPGPGGLAAEAGRPGPT